MRVTRKSIGFYPDGDRIPDEVLVEEAENILIEHEGIKIELRTLRGFADITIVTPEDGNRRQTYIVPYGAVHIQQTVVEE